MRPNGPRRSAWRRWQRATNPRPRSLWMASSEGEDLYRGVERRRGRLFCCRRGRAFAAASRPAGDAPPACLSVAAGQLRQPLGGRLFPRRPAGARHADLHPTGSGRGSLGTGGTHSPELGEDGVDLYRGRSRGGFGVADRNDDGGLAMATIAAGVGAGLALGTFTSSFIQRDIRGGGTEHAVGAVSGYFYGTIIGVLSGAAGGLHCLRSFSRARRTAGRRRQSRAPPSPPFAAFGFGLEVTIRRLRPRLHRERPGQAHADLELLRVPLVGEAERAVERQLRRGAPRSRRPAPTPSPERRSGGRRRIRSPVAPPRRPDPRG